jgi:hypothetical protein
MAACKEKTLSSAELSHRHLDQLPRAERLQRIGMLIDSPDWCTLPLAARERYLDIVTK